MTTQTISDLGHEPTPEFKSAVLNALLAQGLSINPVQYFDGDLFNGQDALEFVEVDGKPFDVNYWIDDSTFHITAYPAIFSNDGELETDYSTFWRILIQPIVI
jgi:hypothetical protein